VRADIFKLHSLIVDDYKSYIQSVININDPEIRKVVENELSKGKLWPEPVPTNYLIRSQCSKTCLHYEGMST